MQLAGRSVECRFAAVRLANWLNRSRSRADWEGPAQVLAATPKEYRESAEFHLLTVELLVARAKAEESLKAKYLGEARKILEAARAAAPRELVFWLALAELEKSEKGTGAALVVLEAAEKELGDGVPLRLARANCWVSQRVPADRLKGLETKIESFAPREQARLMLGLADAYSALGSEADARRLLGELTRLQPNNLAFHTRLFDHLAWQDDAKDLEAMVETIRRLEGEDGVAWRYADAVRHAAVALRDRSPSATLLARNRLAEIAPRRPQWGRIPLLEAELDNRSGNIEAAIAKYRRAIQLGVRSIPVVKRTVELLMSRRRFDEAREVLVLASTEQSSPEYDRLSAVLSLNRREPREETLALAAAAVPFNSSEPRDHAWRGMILASLNQDVEAEAALRKAVQLGPTDATNWVALVTFLAGANKKADAQEMVKLAEARLPEDDRAACLARCYAALGDRVTAAKHNVARALRRRLRLALGIGAVLAATAATLVWVFLPPPKPRASAKLYTNNSERGTLFEHPDSQISQQTQTTLIKSEAVITAALRKPEVNQTELIRQQADPVDWLARELIVDYPSGDEIVRISLVSMLADDAAKIVDAVKAAYLEEFVNKSAKARRERLDRLQALQTSAHESLKRKQATVRKLAEAVGSTRPENVAMQQQLVQEQYGTAQREYVKLQSDLRRLQLEESSLKAGAVLPRTPAESSIKLYVDSDPVVKDLEARMALIESKIRETERVATKAVAEVAAKKAREDLSKLAMDRNEARTKARADYIASVTQLGEQEGKTRLAQLSEQIAFHNELNKVLLVEIERLGKSARSINTANLDLEAEKIEIQTAEDLYAKVAAAISTLLAENEAPSRVAHLENARVERVNAEARKMQFAGFAGVAALGFVCLVVALFEYRNQRVDSVAQAGLASGLTVLGTIP